MMSSFLPYVILSCMLYKTVVTQVSVSANKYPTHGATITLTCNITSFSLPSSWINDTSSGILSTCRSTGTCSPTTSGRYSYSATNSTIVAQISAFDASSDDFGWKCLHDTDTHVFKFTFTTTTISSPTTTTITSVDFITPSTIIPTDNIGSSSVLPTSVYVVASGTLTSTNNISFGNAVTSSSIMQTVSNSASVTLTDVVTHGTMRPIYNTGYSNVSVTLLFIGTPISTASIYNTDTVSQSSDQTQWWCKRDWCIGLGVASGGLLVFSFVIGIIIFSKKRKDLENHMCWQIWTISIVVVVVIIIAVTGVLAGIVCLNCWKEKK